MHEVACSNEWSKYFTSGPSASGLSSSGIRSEHHLYNAGSNLGPKNLCQSFDNVEKRTDLLDWVIDYFDSVELQNPSQITLAVCLFRVKRVVEKLLLQFIFPVIFSRNAEESSPGTSKPGQIGVPCKT